MLQKIDKKNKIYIYLFIFFLLSTFNNVQLVNSNFFNFDVDNVKVFGLSEKNNLQISQEIKKEMIKNIFFLPKDLLLKTLKKNNLVHDFEIKKIYPNTIEVKIQKTEFLGVINIDRKLFLIGSNGKLIYSDNIKKNLPRVFGKINTYRFIEFVKTIRQSTFDFNKIVEIYFFPSGRWDIKTRDNKLFKLPLENLEYNLNSIYEINKNEEFINSNIIDLRFNGKIIFTNEWKRNRYLF